LEHELTIEVELNQIAEAFLGRAVDPDGFLNLVHTEVLAS
jgi:hypothetical protein